MKYVRFEKDGFVRQGILEGDVIRLIEGDFFNAPTKTDLQFNLEDTKIIAPVTPTKIIAIGLNYIDHAKELNLSLPDEPLIFLKPPSSVIGPYGTIYYPPQAMRIDYEAELAIIIKKEARDILYEEAEEYIFGYTCLNDVTARDLQKKDGQWTRAKSFDTFCPIGPYIETEIDASSLKIELLVNPVRDVKNATCRSKISNGVNIKQSSNTSKMIFDCRKLVQFISGIMTLLPGDVIATGTPAGVGPLNVGDEAEVRIENLGSLINPVRSK
jgi:2-keto-4-pentenoate hydratase/2-oxohepta-3-ene-1,7-dioic acid hydratase in catechol pathway